MAGCCLSKMCLGMRSAVGLSMVKDARLPKYAAPPLSMPQRRSRPKSSFQRPEFLKKTLNILIYENGRGSEAQVHHWELASQRRRVLREGTDE
ncbi:hypothetical protein INR49_002282 [Caranx melampygus]|nr:hypothetical protein INR49_002282 [Caranx melampygus]